MSEGQPPPTNRGAEIRVAVDWLQFSVLNVAPEEVERVLAGYGISDFVDMDRGLYGYRRQRMGPGASRILYEGRGPEVHVVLPGAAIRTLDEIQVRGLLLWVRASGRAVRLDLAGDDTARSVVPAAVCEAVMRGELVTHTRTRTFTRDLAGDGATVTFGKRGSRSFLRVYDKTAESGGAVDAVRWELEFRDEMAEKVASELVTKSWGEVWAARLVTLVDFRLRWQRADVEKCERSPWFVALVEAAEKWVAWAPETLVSVERARAWLDRQVWPSLALVVAAEGGDMAEVYGGIASGRVRWKAAHKAALSAALAA